jgi:PadR family transcriptional regulator, regulatory protein PadR
MCDEHHGRRKDGPTGCCPSGGQVRGFLRPWLLLLLAKNPAHGYELMDRLEQDEETPGADPGSLYRTLRKFEEQGLVCSTWDTTESGPARRVYEITEAGMEYLHAWAVNIRRTRERLDRFLAEYESQFRAKER